MAYVNPLAATLVTNPAKPPDLVFLKGFIGPGAAAGQTRLFVTPVMNRFLDIPDGQIVHSETGLAVPGSPWPEDVVWLARTDAENLREDGTSLVAAAGEPGSRRTNQAGTPAGTVLTINVGVGPGQQGGGDGGIGTGGPPNWHQKWPGG